VASSCAYTTSTSSLAPHLKTLAVPVFENLTPESGLEQDITTAIVNAYVRNNRLRLVTERDADCLLSGKVIYYKNSVFGFSTETQAQEYQVRIGVAVVFKDQVRNRELWRQDNLLKNANYYVVDVPGQTAKTEVEGRQYAIAKIAEEIVARTVEGW
jgi:hypothetical protein